MNQMLKTALILATARILPVALAKETILKELLADLAVTPDPLARSRKLLDGLTVNGSFRATDDLREELKIVDFIAAWKKQFEATPDLPLSYEFSVSRAGDDYMKGCGFFL